MTTRPDRAPASETPTAAPRSSWVAPVVGLVLTDAFFLLLGLLGPAGWLSFVVLPGLALAALLLVIGWIGLFTRHRRAGGAPLRLRIVFWVLMGIFFLTHSDFGDAPPAARSPLESALGLEPMTLVVVMGLSGLGALLVAAAVAWVSTRGGDR